METVEYDSILANQLLIIYRKYLMILALRDSFKGNVRKKRE